MAPVVCCWTQGKAATLAGAVPLIEVLEGGWPWLLLFPIALLGAWCARQSRWGYWSLGTLAVLAAAILPLRTQLPWYSHPALASVRTAMLHCWHGWSTGCPGYQAPCRCAGSWLSSLRCGQAWGLLLIAGLVSLTPAADALSDYRSTALCLELAGASAASC